MHILSCLLVTLISLVMFYTDAAKFRAKFIVLRFANKNHINTGKVGCLHRSGIEVNARSFSYA